MKIYNIVIAIICLTARAYANEEDQTIVFQNKAAFLLTLQSKVGGINQEENYKVTRLSDNQPARIVGEAGKIDSSGTLSGFPIYDRELDMLQCTSLASSQSWYVENYSATGEGLILEQRIITFLDDEKDPITLYKRKHK